ncbi:MAG TPA: STAS domain-containing protein [Ilumatobacteraceae bacterium]|nr:STAS domain-containing protein [Ilumatobacteraceae bacterium]
MVNDGSRLSIESTDDELVVAGEIDAHSCNSLDAAIAETGGSHIRLELSGVTFIDSSGLRVLVDHHHRLAESGDRLAIVRPSRPVQRLLEIAGLDGQFHIDVG